MIVIKNTYISDDLYRVYFVCHLEKCKGACCVAGDAGAPLLEEEISLLEDGLRYIRSNMTPEGIRTVETKGVFDYDSAGELVTPLVDGKECAFANFTDGIAWCAIEKTYEQGFIRFRKPLSCHLYPVRITSYPQFQAVNYHQWHICKPALEYGQLLKTPLYKFLKDALIRCYGKTWYDKLLSEIEGTESL